jgi:hypothetical protein
VTVGSVAVGADTNNVFKSRIRTSLGDGVVWHTPNPELHPRSDHYDTNYGNFQSELYARIRRDAFGSDIGRKTVG